MWRIMQIKEDVINRGWKPKWITFSEICKILHIVRQLLLVQNICQFLISLVLADFFQNFGLFPARFQDVNSCFFLQILPKLEDKINRAICTAHSWISSIQFRRSAISSSKSSKRHLFSPRLPKQPRFQSNIHRIDGILFASSQNGKRPLVMKN